MRRLLFSLMLTWFVGVMPCDSMVAFASGALGHIGSFEKWSKVEIVFSGPDSVGMSEYANPFEIVVEVVFTDPDGRSFVVPAFYDGDGAGGVDGNVWKVRFSADETGVWSFMSSSAESLLDGYTGSFTVTVPGPDAPEFYKWGRLEYVGTAVNELRYLKFRDGPYWLKAGCDDPENFLGSFSNYNTLAKRKSAIDYLARKGVNSMYIMTHNIDGDAKDVWPWLGDTAGEAKSNGGSGARFDVAKLEEWRELFEYMQGKGVVAYLILEDDSAWSGYDHARYYREMVARFGYLPALLFNLGEEYTEGNSLADGLYYAQELEDIDPYDHPIAIHDINSANDNYVDASQLDFTSIQTDGTDPFVHNQLAIDWINRCKSLGRRVLMVGFDEPRPLMDRKGWWSGYMGGGVWEVHVAAPYDRPMDVWETAWNELGGARVFMEALPFWEMEPSNSLVISGTAFCLSNPGEVYGLYLPLGGTVTVDLVEGLTYDYRWWNPANDNTGNFQNGGSVGGGQQQFTAPGSGDWALQIIRSDAVTNIAPMVSDGSVTVAPGGSIDITLSYTDPDGPGPYTFTIIEPPSHGILSGDDGDQWVGYTPDAGYTGADSFTWIVDDGLQDSNEARVTITVGGIYFPPPGESLAMQSIKAPERVGLDSSIVSDLESVIVRGIWALWRHGYLVHLAGDFNTNSEIKSVRKTLHATTVGAAIQKGLIPSLDQKISVWNPELTGANADATWFHVLSQTSAFDEPTLPPGSLWAYSDANPFQLNRALARVWGYSDFTADYDAVIGDALLDPIGAQGWSTSVRADGIRLHMDLEDLGRLGLLMVARGDWNGTSIIPEWFADQLITKQTYGIPPKYDNSNDGHTGLRVEDFPESPYGLMTWVNTDRDLYPAAAATWAVCFGAGGHWVAFDPSSGIVLAIKGGEFAPVPDNPPGWPTQIRIALETIGNNVSGPNPLVFPPDATPPSAPMGLSASGSGQTVTLSWLESSDPESGIMFYRIYRGDMPGGPKSQIAQVGAFATVFDDTSTAPCTEYFYEISAINGAGLESDKGNSAQAITLCDATPPNVVSASANGYPTTVTVVFSEAVEETSATNEANYSIDNGIIVWEASLGPDLKTVTLGTSPHSDGVTYILTVNNIYDRASTPNEINADTQVSYVFATQLVISNLTVASGRNYEVISYGLSEGALAYTDRQYTYRFIPEWLEAATYIKTANNDKSSSEDSFISFDVNQDVIVYVAHDNRISPKPSWLAPFTDTGEDLTTTDTSFSIFAKYFPAGTVTLGGNEGAGKSMYVVAIVASQSTNAPPTLSITGPADGSVFSEGDDIAITAVASDSDGIVVKVDFFAGGNLLGTSTNAPYSYTWTNVIAGSHIVTLTAIDDDGDTGTATGTITVGKNILTNGDFSDGNWPWTFYTNGSGNYSVVNGKARVAVNTRGSNVQLYQTPLVLEGNTLYRLTFRARHSTGSDVIVGLIKHTVPHTNCGLWQAVDLTEAMQTFSFDFTTPPGARTDARFMFYMAPFDQNGTSYFFDDVFLEALP